MAARSRRPKAASRASANSCSSAKATCPAAFLIFTARASIFSRRSSIGNPHHRYLPFDPETKTPLVPFRPLLSSATVPASLSRFARLCPRPPAISAFVNEHWAHGQAAKQHPSSRSVTAATHPWYWRQQQSAGRPYGNTQRSLRVSFPAIRWTHKPQACACRREVPERSALLPSTRPHGLDVLLAAVLP